MPSEDAAILSPLPRLRFRVAVSPTAAPWARFRSPLPRLRHRQTYPTLARRASEGIPRGTGKNGFVS
jgi:hypothetical protein